MSDRNIIRLVPSRYTNDGDGVKIRRVAISGNMGVMDPFLLLDELGSDDAADYIGGFPSHPHRGFETVTYMLEGKMRHTDHMGNEGVLTPGSVQWMTAGRGVIHSEMPEQSEGRLHGFQLWVNLPAKDKMQEPRYQEFSANQIPQLDLAEVGSAKIIAGEWQGVVGPVNEIATQPSYFDVHLNAGGSATIPTMLGHNTMLFVYDGSVRIGENVIENGQLAQLEDGDSVTLTGVEPARFLFLSAKPISEPIAHWGPFVMNTREEIDQAILDYRNGKLVAQ